MPGRTPSASIHLNRAALIWVLIGWAGFAVLPWYDGGLGRIGGAGAWPFGAAGPALALGFGGGAWWLAPIGLPLLAATFGALRVTDPARMGGWLVWAGLLGLGLIAAEGLAIDHRGWTMPALAGLDPAVTGQKGLGWGGAVTAAALLMLLARGLAARGWCRGDAFMVSAITGIIALIALFVFVPVAAVLKGAFLAADGSLSLGGFAAAITDGSIWGLACLGASVSCGVAWNTLVLAAVVGVGSTAIGLAFALIATRTAFRFKGLMRVISVLPIITPPFVIGLAIILLFGRTGAVTTLMFDVFGLPRSRWIYGFPGVVISQLLAFTPIAFLVLVGVVQGVSPTMEEAAQTLRASRWTTFRTVTLPLMRPGLANAFLLGFVESMADFGNPLVLGGNFEVLSTKIFFAVVGAAHDPGRAAVLSIVLLAFTLLAFWAQHAWLGKRTYTTLTGKGDAGMALPLPLGVAILSYAVAVPWALFTMAIYVLIAVGGFVEAMGRDYTPTLRHFLTGFRIEQTPRGLFFSGSAWNSLFTTLEVAAVAAPITAAVGLLTAYLLSRQKFAGRRAFEFMTMLSFAIPGTVIGVSYILAFNVPPVELTGTGLILVICFVFRNMPVGVRSGIATMSQIDKSLDEASTTLGARTWTTLRRVILPLLRPAIVASLVYSFVRAITGVSAVIFLVSAEYNMATTYIVGRVEAGEFGLAIAYSFVLIVVMLIAILGIQLLVGERRLGRRGVASVAPAAAVA